MTIEFHDGVPAPVDDDDLVFVREQVDGRVKVRVTRYAVSVPRDITREECLEVIAALGESLADAHSGAEGLLDDIIHLEERNKGPLQ